MRIPLVLALLAAVPALADVSVVPSKPPQPPPVPPPTPYCKLTFAPPERGDWIYSRPNVVTVLVDKAGAELASLDLHADTRRLTLVSAGRARWHLDNAVRAGEHVVGQFVDNALFVVAFDEHKEGARLLAIDPANGKLRWTTVIEHWEQGHQPIPHTVRLSTASRENQRLIVVTNFMQSWCSEVYVDQLTGKAEQPRTLLYAPLRR
jgi:hypothetical protein